MFIVPDFKRQKLFPNVVPSRIFLKRSCDIEVTLAQKSNQLLEKIGRFYIIIVSSSKKPHNSDLYR